MTLEPAADVEASRVEAWRLEQLLDAGYALVDAEKIAARYAGPDAIDLHQALALVRKGCAPAMAAAILL